MEAPDTTAPAADVPTQPAVPSESAGTQTAAGSPSEQPGAAVAVPPSAGEPTAAPAALAVDPTVTASEPEPGSTTSDATASQSGIEPEPEPQPVDADGNPIPAPSEAPAADIVQASGTNAAATQAAYDEAERLEQEANGTPWPTHDITTSLLTADTVLIEPEQPDSNQFDRVPQKQVLRTQ
jgi:hypothetical protein